MTVNLIIHFSTDLYVFPKYIIVLFIGLFFSMVFTLIVENSDNHILLYAYFISFMALSLITSRIYDTYYIQWRWIENCKYGYLLGSSKEEDTSKIENYCHCRYEKLNQSYSNVDEFPDKCRMTESEIYDDFICLINSFKTDTARQRHLNNIEKYVIETLIDREKECK